MTMFARSLLMSALAGMMVVSAGCKTPELGVQDNMLKPCPSSPNCVSSAATDDAHHIDPLTYKGTKEAARKKLTAIIASFKRAKVINDEPDYIHATFTSLIFRFKDDVEFYFDESKPVIEIRSASRVGYSDFGVNRKRIERIRAAFDK